MQRIIKIFRRNDTVWDILHGDGISTRGVPAAEIIESRAQELAMIAGRKPLDVHACDRIRARREWLRAKSAAALVEDLVIIGRGYGQPVSPRGYHREKRLPYDDGLETEAVITGLPEVLHDSVF
jgi:hypothetical protein